MIINHQDVKTSWDHLSKGVSVCVWLPCHHDIMKQSLTWDIVHSRKYKDNTPCVSQEPPPSFTFVSFSDRFIDNNEVVVGQTQVAAPQLSCSKHWTLWMLIAILRSKRPPPWIYTKLAPVTPLFWCFNQIYSENLTSSSGSKQFEMWIIFHPSIQNSKSSKRVRYPRMVWNPKYFDANLGKSFWSVSLNALSLSS